MESNFKNITASKFKEAVQEIAKKKDDVKIHHVGADKSAVILGTIFKYSNHEIRLFVGDFNGAISNDEYYLEKLKKFILRGGKLSVIVNDIGVTPSKAYQMICTYESFNPNVSILEYDFTGELDIGIHFAIGDDYMYRIEIDTENYIGVASFNDKELSRSLIDYFDAIFKEKKENSIS